MNYFVCSKVLGFPFKAQVGGRDRNIATQFGSIIVGGSTKWRHDDADPGSRRKRTSDQQQPEEKQQAARSSK